MIAAKDMKCASFPNLALSTLLALMNVLVTFNAHLSLSDTLVFDSPSFLFFYPILACVSLPGIIFCNTIYISLFTLCFDEIHLIGFYFVTWCFCINSYKNTRGRRRAFARNVDFSFIVSGSERTFTFRVSLNTLPTLATLVRDIYTSQFTY